MLVVKRDEEGNIIAVCEWWAFTDGGLAIDGEIVYLFHTEINKDHRGNGLLKEIYKEVAKLNPHMKKCSWMRGYKYPNRKPTECSKIQITKRIGG